MAEGKSGKKALAVIGIITAALAFLAGAAVLSLKLIEKKKSKEEYYIECDLSEDKPEIDEQSEQEVEITLEE